MTDTMYAPALLMAIDNAIEKDSGNLYRKYLGEIMPTLDDAYRQSDKKFRPHMGASLQGNQCARAIWYSFRWFTAPTHPARIQRLFNRGHMEEGRVLALLKMIGCKVNQYDENGKQYTIHGADGHYGGSGDGIVGNIPGLPPEAWAVFECKTHSEKSFTELVKKGVKESKYEHYVQTQQYMFKFQIPLTLYMAVNKNTDALHAEFISVNPELAAQYIDRAERIVWLKQAPPRHNSASPGHLSCRWCDHKPVCWQGAVPDKNCRTCMGSAPVASGKWVCTKYGNFELSRDQQELGCTSWEELK